MKAKTWLALLAALAVIAVAVVVVGFGGNDNTASASGNSADAAFIADMTAHHQGAIEMAGIAQSAPVIPKSGSSPTTSTPRSRAKSR